MLKVAVIILNWNGEKLLKEYLPSVVRYSNSDMSRIVVADNASDDASVQWTREHYPEVELLCFDKNHGFAGGYNLALEKVKEEVVVLLNSDVEVTPYWLEPMLEILEKNADIVAVQPKIKAWKNKKYFEYAGACGGYIDQLGFPFCRGRILDVTEEDKGQYDDKREVFWCSGAALCVRRSAYVDAGGLDERFFAHMEEIDLCWRLRNRGGRLMVCPSSVVFHLGGGSLPMHHPRKLFLNYRNNLLMLYKNLSVREWRRLIRKRCLLDLAAATLFLLKGEFANTGAVFKAYRDFYQLKSDYSPRNEQRADACIYRGSIVFAYYLKGVRKFSCLWK